MNDLYSELINGTVEFKDGGVITKHPPSVLALRAARAVKQLSEINQGNENMLMQSQSQAEQLLQQNIHLHNTINELQRQLSALQEVRTHSNRPNSVQSGSETSGSSGSESLREGEWQTGSVGRSDGQHFASDSDSTGSRTTEADSIGTGTN